MISQKATAICIYEILKKYSDEDHIMTAEMIREKLKLIYDVDMERRAIYRNIEALRDMGVEIEGYRDNRKGYYLIEREFELSEIRLLCDAIAGSDMIDVENGKEIIKKLIDTQSIFQGRMLQKTVFVKSEKRILNKQIFYNIDVLNVAINQGCKVQAKYMKYGFDHELVECSDSLLIISPYVTFWADDNYYILAKRDGSEKLEHFRVDFIKDIVILEIGVDMLFGGFNPGQYAKHYIINNGETKERYEIECNKKLWQDMAEFFGNEAIVIREDGGKEKIKVRISAIPSVMKRWVMCHVTECQVLLPKKFREDIQRTVKEAYFQYW